MILVKILMALLLGLAAWQDFKTQLVSDWLMLPFCILTEISALVNGQYFSAAIAAVIVLTVYIIPESEKIGGADLLLIAGFTAFFGLIHAVDALIVLCLLSLAIYAAERILKVNFITKNGGIALLVPAFFVFILEVIL